MYGFVCVLCMVLCWVGVCVVRDPCGCGGGGYMGGDRYGLFGW